MMPGNAEPPLECFYVKLAVFNIMIVSSRSTLSVFCLCNFVIDVVEQLLDIMLTYIT